MPMTWIKITQFLLSFYFILKRKIYDNNNYFPLTSTARQLLNSLKHFAFCGARLKKLFALDSQKEKQKRARRIKQRRLHDQNWSSGEIPKLAGASSQQQDWPAASYD